METPANVANKIDDRPSATAIHVDGASHVERLDDRDEVRRKHPDDRQPTSEIHSPLRAVVR